jgi:hypothetical protein
MCYDCMHTKLTQKDDAIIPVDTKTYVEIYWKLHYALSVDDTVQPLKSYAISMEQQYREPSRFLDKLYGVA